MLPKDRFPVLVEGANLLVEHVATLRRTTAHLLERNDPRGAAILDAVAIEEAAKILILLDFARAGTKVQARLKQTVRHFYDHVARGIYAEVALMAPANYAEIREMVEYLRPALYRDGPEGFEWVFRNRIEARREEITYVDFIRDDESTRWVTPGTRDASPIWQPSHVTDVVVAMQHAGLYSHQGFDAIAAAWHDVVIEDDLHWQDVRGKNVEILDAVGRAGLQQAQLTERELSLAVERWSFPMFDLDLRKRRVEDAELDEQLKRGEAQFYSSIYGDP